MLIYCIYNKINTKCYIGQTKRNLKIRKQEHKRSLQPENNEHENNYLQHAWDKYGEENFKFIVLEKNFANLKELNEAESFWINNLQTLYFQHGYNLYRDGRNRVVHQETINKHIKQVHQYDKSGNFIRSWKRASIPANKLGIYETGIISACNESRKSAGGYQWSYDKKEKMKSYQERTKLDEETKHKMGSTNRGVSPYGKWKKSIIEANKSRVWTKEMRKKVSEGNKNKTFSEESLQKMRKNSRGSNNNSAKLTEKDVYRMRFGDLSNKNRKELINIFGVSRTTIRNIKQNESWSHITENYYD